MSTVAKGERARGGLGVAMRTPIELWIAVIFMALAFVGGVTIGVLAEQREQPAVGVAPVSQLPAGQFTAAPPLTEEQIQQGLPPGHPDLSGGPADTGGSGTSGSGGDRSSQQEQSGGKNDKGSQATSDQGTP